MINPVFHAIAYNLHRCNKCVLNLTIKGWQPTGWAGEVGAID